MDFNDKTLTLFKGFINDIMKVFPEHKESLNKNYNDILELDNLNIDENEIIKEFLDLIDSNSDSITNKNSEIFTDDLYLIKEISMKSIWDSGISDRTKENIWKYLQSFCLINISKNSNDQINEVLKSIESKEKIKDKKTLKDMKKIKKINENLKNNTDEQSGGSDGNSPDNKDNKDKLNDMDNLINNTSIGNLAKEITEDLNLDEMGEDGMSEFMKPENMMNIFQKINSTLTDKISNNELDGNALLGEASGLMNNNDMMKGMMNMFGNTGNNNDNPGMPDLSGMMNMFQNMNNQSSNNQPSNNQTTNNGGNHDPNVVRERLKNKLNNKNNKK
uniref:Uncharacterized protein n=1 Tax=viral metagenome TaxID=1070528 RepID=A0A6C0C6U7_9ZZZZ